VKTLFVTNDFPPKVGGVSQYVDQIARRFPDGQIRILAPAFPGAASFDASYPHEVIRWGSKVLLPTPGAADRIIDLVGADRPDVMLFGAALPFARLGGAVQRRTGVPFATFTHGVEVGWGRVPPGRTVLRRIAREALFLTTVSGWTERVLRRAVGPGPRIELLPPGVDTALFHPDVSDTAIRERHGLDGNRVICCVSRLVPRKGQDQIIKALPAISAAFPETRFLVVGSGRYETRLRALAHERGVARQVIFAGEVGHEDLPGYFRAGDVFAMPCRSRHFGLEVEAIGVVFLEALAVGRPSVVGNSGGAPEVARDGEAGVVVDGRSTTSVGRGIISLFEDPERAAKMGRAGAEWIQRELGWDAIAVRLRDLLADALASGRRP
jgi:phosphatidylinositol alpha-1,6-mannosyltransferase